MFFVSVGLMLVHVVFTAIWLVFFSRVFLIGHIENTIGKGMTPSFCYCALPVSPTDRNELTSFCCVAGHLLS